MKSYDLKINGKSFNVGIESANPDGSAKVIVNGKEYFVQLSDENSVVSGGPEARVSASGSSVPHATTVKAADPVPQSGECVVTSPLPGVIIGINVNVGDSVKVGQRLATLEAMKMENAIEAECAGTVKKIFVQKGDSILEGAKIIMIG